MYVGQRDIKLILKIQVFIYVNSQVGNTIQEKTYSLKSMLG